MTEPLTGYVIIKFIFFPPRESISVEFDILWSDANYVMGASPESLYRYCVSRGIIGPAADESEEPQEIFLTVIGP
jgi:hypothetical protein